MTSPHATPPPPRPSPSSLASLASSERLVLAAVEHLVPASERLEWSRSWHAELWCNHHQALRRGVNHSLFFGLLHDALWLRAESYRCALAGTAVLCLLLLCALVTLASLPLLAASGSLQALGTLLLCQISRFAVASPLILFVSYATSSSGIQHDAAASVGRWLKAHSFLAAKTLLLLLLTFLCSTDLSFPLEARASFAALPLQMLFFVLLALLALRWNFRDGDSRCKHCLRSLTAPARVGRPSHNFLEWNGTELLCRDGHGLLSIPELETSWCQASRWVPQPLP